jgi:hypothetical protein
LTKNVSSSISIFGEPLEKCSVTSKDYELLNLVHNFTDAILYTRECTKKIPLNVSFKIKRDLLSPPQVIL